MVHFCSSPPFSFHCDCTHSPRACFCYPLRYPFPYSLPFPPCFSPLPLICAPHLPFTRFTFDPSSARFTSQSQALRLRLINRCNNTNLLPPPSTMTSHPQTSHLPPSAPTSSTPHSKAVQNWIVWLEREAGGGGTGNGQMEKVTVLLRRVRPFAFVSF